MSGTFTKKYSDAERAAITYAYEDRQIRPASRVVELAASGELTHQGEKVPPFETNANTVRDFARDLRKKRRGERTSQLADQPPRDAIEQLRRRLVNAADALLLDYEDDVKRKPGDADPERLRQIVRVVREAAHLPGPNDPRPVPPGAKRDGKREGGETKGGPAGAIIRAAQEARASAPAPAPRHNAHTEHRDTTQHSNNNATHHQNTAPNTQHDDEPGSGVRELAEKLGYDLTAGV